MDFLSQVHTHLEMCHFKVNKDMGSIMTPWLKSYVTEIYMYMYMYISIFAIAVCHNSL